MNYEDFEVRFQTTGTGRYSTYVMSSPAGQGQGSFVDSSYLAELDAYQAELEQLAPRDSSDALGEGTARELDAGRNRRQESREAARSLGRALFSSLFSGEVLELYLRSIHYLADEEHRALRLKLSFDPSCPALLGLCGLPWELLRREATDEVPALSRRTPLIRHLDLRRPLRRPPFEPPVRILAVTSNPPGTSHLDLKRELAEIETAWRGRGVLECLPCATPERLSAALQSESNSFHHLYFMGHGTFQKATGAVIALHSSQGGPAWWASADFVTLLRDHTTLRLVVLTACSTAAVAPVGGPGPFAGIATALMLAEIPSVVAMQTPIADCAAITFSQALHRHLAAGDPVEAAVVAARLALHNRNPYSFEWAIPAMFSQLPLGEEPPWPRERSRVRKALEALSPEGFENVRQAFDLRGEIPAVPDQSPKELPIDRRDRAEKLLSLASDRGEERWIELQESTLAIRSPFSPFTGSLRDWARRPESAWQLGRGKLVGFGSGGAPFADAPEDLREGALLTWEELRFRDGALRARLWLPTLGEEAAAGLVLRHQEGRGLVLGLLRSAPGEAARAELWQRESLGWRRLAAEDLFAPEGKSGWHELELLTRRDQVELRTPGAASLAVRHSVEAPPGHAGLVRFGGTAVEVSDLILTVWPRGS